MQIKDLASRIVPVMPRETIDAGGRLLSLFRSRVAWNRPSGVGAA